MMRPEVTIGEIPSSIKVPIQKLRINQIFQKDQTNPISLTLHKEPLFHNE